MMNRILIIIACLNISASISCMHTLARRIKPSQPITSHLVSKPSLHTLIAQRSLMYVMSATRNEKWERSDALDRMVESSSRIALPQLQTRLPWFASNKNRFYFATISHIAYDPIGGFVMDSYIAFDDKKDLKQFMLNANPKYLELLCHGHMDFDSDAKNQFSVRKSPLKAPTKFGFEVCRPVKLFCYKGPHTVVATKE